MGLGHSDIHQFSNPTSLTDFNCLGLNVMGEGIPSTDGSLVSSAKLTALLNKTTYCSYPGVLSKPVVPTSATSTLSVELSTGKSRLIQVLGVKTNGNECGLGTDFYRNTWGTKEIYEVGRAVMDITGNHEIAIENSYTGLPVAQLSTRRVTCANKTYASLILSESGLTGYWRMGESSGDAADGVAGGAYGAMTLTGATYGQTGVIPNDPDTAISFSGASSYGSLVSGPNYGPGLSANFTIETWWKSTQDCSTYRPLVYFQSTSTNSPYISLGCVLQSSVHIAKFSIKNSGNYTETAYGTSAINDGVWHHIVGVKSGANMYLYVDGSLQATEPYGYDDTTDIRGESSATIAYDGSSTYTNGTQDEIAVYSRALSAAEVLAHYQYGMGTLY